MSHENENEKNKIVCENCLKEHRHEKNQPFKECQVRKSTLMSHKSALSVVACPLKPNLD